jgi:hypothetical protein
VQRFVRPLSCDPPTQGTPHTGVLSLPHCICISFPSHLRGRRSTTATAKATTEARLELAGGATLLARLAALVTTTVATLTVTTGTTTAATTGTTLALVAAHHATGRLVAALLLDVGGGHDLGGKVQPLAQVLETLGSQGVVVVLPREAGLEVAARGQGLAGLDDLVV